MRIRMPYFTLILPFVLGLGWGVTAGAQQEKPSQPPQKAAEKPAAQPGTPAVSPEMLEKAKTYKGSPVPPKHLVKEADGHWTPYTPPEKPPEGVQVYTIQPGDTLSKIAQAQLGTWQLWPQIWDENPYIKDAHWIYPGDPLYIKKPQVVSEHVPLEPEPLPPKQPEKPKTGGMELEQEAPMPPVSSDDVYCSGFITKHFKRPHLTILSAPERERESLAQGDVVYLNEGKDEGMQPGMLFSILEPGQTVSHPITGRNLGRYVRRVGQAKVLAVQPHASIAEISQSCDEIRYGDVLVPWQVIPIPWDIKRSPSIPLDLPPSTKPQGRVVWSEDRIENMGDSQIVYIDLGSREGLLPGDKLWFYRFPGQTGTFTDTTRDLFRQQRINVGPKDLYRMPKVGKYEGHEESMAEGGTAQAGVETETKSEKERQSDLLAREDKLRNSQSGAVKALRMYLGEGVVLTTEGRTACVKIISSNSSITFGDRVQME